MHITLITATLNRTAEIKALLESLASQSHKDFDLILVDQNADDRLCEIVQAFSVRMRLCHIRSSSGLSLGRNVGLRLATGTVIGFPDDDCVYARDTLFEVDRLLSAQLRTDAIVGRSVLTKSHTSEALHNSQVINSFNVWRLAISYTMFVRDHVARSVGFFDEDLGVGSGTPWQAGEETDYLLRALKLGYTVRRTDSVIVFHPNKDAAQDDALRRARSYSRGVGRVLAKNSGSFGLQTIWSLSKSLAGLAASPFMVSRGAVELAGSKLAGKLSGIRSFYLARPRPYVSGHPVPDAHLPLHITARPKKDRPIDVSFFVPNLNGGGAERVMLALAREFQETGLNVEFVVSRFWGALKEELTGEFPIVNLSSPRVLYSLRAYLRYLRLAKPAVVISSLENANVISCLGKLFSFHNHRLVIRIENSLVEPGGLLRQQKRIGWLICITLTFPLADSFICISQGLKRQLQRLPGISRSTIHRIDNPVLTRDFYDKLSCNPKDLKGRFPGVKHLIALGRLHRQKDYPTLLRAIAIASKHLSLHLTIFGEGDERSNLEELSRSLKIERLVEFRGFVSNPLPYLREADLFVLSSAWEGFGNVIVEALAAGTKVVSTDCRHGPKEILGGGEFGRLVGVGNHVALAEAIVQSLAPSDSAAVPSRLGVHLEKYRVSAVADAYRRVLGI